MTGFEVAVLILLTCGVAMLGFIALAILRIALQIEAGWSWESDNTAIDTSKEDNDEE